MLTGLFDTHAHFSQDTATEVMGRAVSAGMAGVVMVGADARANAGALSAARAVLNGVGREGFAARLALGFDYSSGMEPEEAVREMARMRREAPMPISAVGEIGLDRTHEADASKQRGLFEREVALAAEWGLPVVVHCREAEREVLEVMRAVGSKDLAREGRLGVLHCFVGDAAFAEEVLSLGMMISLSGIVTFRNADALRAVAKTLPLDRLLVETDSPYLAPVPLRGKVNEPAFVEHTVRALATLRGEDVAMLVEATTTNAKRLFG